MLIKKTHAEVVLRKLEEKNWKKSNQRKEFEQKTIKKVRKPQIFQIKPEILEPLYRKKNM